MQADEYAFLSSGGTLWSWPGNNPFRWRDPSGRYGWEDFGNDFYKHSETLLDASLGVAGLGLAGLAIAATGGTVLFALGDGAALSGETALALRGLSGAVALFAGGKAAIDAASRNDGFGCGLALGAAMSGAGVIGEGLGSGPRISGGSRGGATPPGEYLAGKAPKQVAPGTQTLQGQYVNDRGRVEPWTAHYDEYGRQIGRTDYNAGNRAEGIPDTHHHVYDWSNPGEAGREVRSHVPGEYEP